MVSIHGEPKLLNDLKSFSQYDGVSIGLIVGQISTQKCLLVHFAPTPEQSKTTCLDSLKEFDETGLGDHARYVTRMLPGGFNVVGVFIVSKSELFTSANVSIFRKVLKAVDNKLSGSFIPQTQNNPNLVILHYNAAKNEIAVKRFELDSLKNVDCSFKDATQNWCEINTQFNLSERYLESQSRESFADHLKHLFDRIVANVEEMVLHLDDEKRDPKSRLETAVKKSATEKSLTGKLYRLLQPVSSKEMIIGKSIEEIYATGNIPSKVFLNPRASVEEAERAVKEDILRSLGSRFEMHLDSLVDETNGSPEEIERVHEPPRRVLVRPTDWKIQVVDYLFPGEGKQDVVNSCRELLDVQVDPNDVIDTFEQDANPSQMMENAASNVEKSKSSLFIILGAVLAILFAVFLNYFLA